MDAVQRKLRRAQTQRAYQARTRVRHGEKYVQLKGAYLRGELSSGSTFRRLPVRMPREAAILYYSLKLRKVWELTHD